MERMLKRVCAVFVAAVIIVGITGVSLAAVVKNQTDRRLVVVLSRRIIAIEPQATVEISGTDFTSSSLQELIRDGSVIVVKK